MMNQATLIREVMVVNPVVVKPSDSVETVLKLLEEKHISGLGRSKEIIIQPWLG